MPQKFGFPSAEVPSQVAFGSFGVLEVSTTCCRCVGVPKGPKRSQGVPGSWRQQRMIFFITKHLGGKRNDFGGHHHCKLDLSDNQWWKDMKSIDRPSWCFSPYDLMMIPNVLNHLAGAHCYTIMESNSLCKAHQMEPSITQRKFADLWSMFGNHVGLWFTSKDDVYHICIIHVVVWQGGTVEPTSQPNFTREGAGQDWWTYYGINPCREYLWIMDITEPIKPCNGR